MKFMLALQCLLLMVVVFACNWILDRNCPLGIRNVGRPQKSHPLEERWANGAILTRFEPVLFKLSLWLVSVEIRRLIRDNIAGSIKSFLWNLTDYCYLHKHISKHFYTVLQLHCYTQRKIYFFMTQRLKALNGVLCYTSFKYQLCLWWYF